MSPAEPGPPALASGGPSLGCEGLWCQAPPLSVPKAASWRPSCFVQATAPRTGRWGRGNALCHLGRGVRKDTLAQHGRSSLPAEAPGAELARPTPHLQAQGKSRGGRTQELFSGPAGTLGKRKWVGNAQEALAKEVISGSLGTTQGQGLLTLSPGGFFLCLLCSVVELPRWPGQHRPCGPCPAAAGLREQPERKPEPGAWSSPAADQVGVPAHGIRARASRLHAYKHRSPHVLPRPEAPRGGKASKSSVAARSATASLRPPAHLDRHPGGGVGRELLVS